MRLPNLNHSGRLLPILLIATLALSSCVSQNRYQDEVSAKNILESQLQQEQQQNAQLQEERNRLGQQLRNLSEDALSAQQDQLSLIKAQNEQIAVLESSTVPSEPTKSESLETRAAMLSEAESLAQKSLSQTQTPNKTHEILKHQLREQIKIGTVILLKRKFKTVIRFPETSLFSPKSKTLSLSGQLVLKKLSIALREHPQQIRIEAHTALLPISKRRTKTSHNKIFSITRAKQVAQFLISAKVPSIRIQVVGLSDTHPIASNDTPEGREKNRRVELILSSLQG